MWFMREQALESEVGASVQLLEPLEFIAEFGTGVFNYTCESEAVSAPYCSRVGWQNSEWFQEWLKLARQENCNE